MARRLEQPLVLYRIADSRFPIFSGRLAAESGFRWNPKGVEVIYASCSYPGAMLEKLVHTAIGTIPKHQVVATIALPTGLMIETIDPPEHPHWKEYGISQALGREWMPAAKTAVLLVPSIVFEGQNALINPLHPDANRLTVSDPRPVDWDVRLFSKR